MIDSEGLEIEDNNWVRNVFLLCGNICFIVDIRV